MTASRVRAIGVPWFTAKSWPELLAIAADRARLPDAFAEFEQSAGARFDALRAQGAPEVMEGPTPDRVAFIDALRKVPAEQRRALVLYYVCDLSVAQIATETGVPDGTVKARLARGRAALAPTPA